MRTAIADTSFYLALLNPADARHADAALWSQDEALHVIVSEFVLLELGNFLSKLPQRNLLSGLVEYLRDNPHTTVVPLSTAIFDAGLTLYSHRPDKEWSLTDCITFEMMKERGLAEALSTDHHFAQAGFKALLR